MNTHPQFDEDFDLYALGALEGDEKEAIELHLVHCDQCGRRMEEARGRVALMAFAAPAQVARPEVRERLLDRVRRDARRKIVPGREPLLGRVLRWATPILALAVLVLALLCVHFRNENAEVKSRALELVARMEQLRAQTERASDVLDVLTAPETVKVTLVRGTTRAAPEGKAFYNPQKGLVFYAFNMPALSPQQTYELWVIPTQGSPVPAGIFSPDVKGNGEVLLPSLPSGIAAKAFAVTVEPAGGTTKPSGSPLLVGAVS